MIRRLVWLALAMPPALLIIFPAFLLTTLISIPLWIVTGEGSEAPLDWLNDHDKYLLNWPKN